MKYHATSPKEYISQLPEERKAPMEKLRKTIAKNLPNGFKETISYNMIGFVVPHKAYPKGYHCDSKLPLPFINIASQKNFIALYHMEIYANQNLYTWFVNEYPKHCKRKLDMGKSCIRFKNVEEIPFDLIAKLCTKTTVNQWIKTYESIINKKK